MIAEKAGLKINIDLIHPSWRVFIGLVLFTIALITGGMILFFHVSATDTQLRTTKRFLTFNGSNDSWSPMISAVNYMQGDHTKLLYDEIFFNEKIKFQYPPTSLFLIQLLKTEPVKSLITITDSSMIDLLNMVNWIVVLGLIAICIQIFFISKKLYLPEMVHQNRRSNKLFDIGLLVLLCLFFDPVMHAVTLGQVQIWIDVIFALTCLFWLRGNKSFSGILVALLCLLKPQYGLILVWGLVRRQWKFVISATIVLLVGFSISVLIYGLDNNLNYLKVLSYVGQRGEAYFLNDSINGILNRLINNGSNLTFMMNEFPPYNSIVYYGTLITSLVFIGVALVIPRKDEGNIWDFFIISLSSTMASPIAWHHHYGIMLPMFMFLIPIVIAKQPLGRFSTVFLGISYILCASLLPVFNQLAATLINFLQAYVFFGALMTLILLYIICLKPEYNRPAITLAT